MFPFSFWRVDEQKEPRELPSPMWQQLNATFSKIIIGWSWLIYLLSGLISLVCIYFAYCERRRQLESARRLRGIQRDQERPPQKRRPSAAYRDHQIYRHIILSVARYMKNPEGIRPFIEQMDQLQSLKATASDQEQQHEQSSSF